MEGGQGYLKSGALEAVLASKLGAERVPARAGGRSGSLGLAHLG